MSVEILGVLGSIKSELAEIKQMLTDRATAREWYGVAEFATLVGKSDFTVRQWCNLGRVNAEPIPYRREWRISHAELSRYRKDGLLPEDRQRNKKSSDGR